MVPTRSYSVPRRTSRESPRDASFPDPFLFAILALGAGLSAAHRPSARRGYSRPRREYDGRGSPPAKADPRIAIAKKFGEIKVEDVRVSPINGVYEITRGSEISYVTADGKLRRFSAISSTWIPTPILPKTVAA